MKRIGQVLVVSLCFATSAFAHDPKMHKGPKVEGDVVAVQSDRIDLKTPDGVVAVTLAPETSYEEGDAGNKADRSALKKGQHVTVAGHKLPNGGLVAAMVMIGGAHDESEPHHHGDDK